MVWPSGAARATSCAAIMVLAPGLFSTSTGTPSASASLGATTRAWMSVVPPAAKPTSTRIGCPGLGKVCAHAGNANESAQMAMANRFMLFPLPFV